MRLLALPDLAGRPTYWVNADHVALVQRQDSNTGAGIHVVAEVKVDGLPLFRTPVGDFINLADADAARASFLEQLQQGG